MVDVKKRSEVTGLEVEAMRQWLRMIARKAKRNPKSLTLAELNELARVVALLAPRS